MRDLMFSVDIMQLGNILKALCVPQVLLPVCMCACKHLWTVDRQLELSGNTGKIRAHETIMKFVVWIDLHSLNNMPGELQYS